MQTATLAKNSWWRMAKETVSEWSAHRALNLSAALAYYSIFSIAPLVIIAVSVAGLVFGAEAVRGQLDDQLKNYIGGEAAKGVQALLKGAAKPTHGWIGAITGFVALLFGASGVFGQLKESLNTIWSVQQKPGGGVWGFVRERLLSFGMVLVIGFLLLISLLLSTVIAALSGSLNHWLGIPSAIWAAVSTLLSFGMVTLLFGAIFKILPDAKVGWRDVWSGALMTAALFEVGKLGLSFYLGREAASSYGAAGSVLLLLLWIYYASCILLMGAEFTRVYATAQGHHIEPAENAEFAEGPVEKPAEPERLKPAPEKEHLAEATALHTSPHPVAEAKKTGGLLARIGQALGIAGAGFLAGRLTAKKEPEQDVEKAWSDLGEAAGKGIAGFIEPPEKR